MYNSILEKNKSYAELSWQKKSEGQNKSQVTLYHPHFIFAIVFFYCSHFKIFILCLLGVSNWWDLAFVLNGMAEKARKPLAKIVGIVG